MACITVLGAGNSGIAMAAHLSSQGHSVCLWNRSYKNIETLCENGIIKSEGVVNGEFHLDKVTVAIAEAVSYADLILVTTPSNAHKDLASAISPYVTGDKTIILNPGRTFGAVYFKYVLMEHGCKNTPRIAETQTIIYTCRKITSTHVNIITFKNGVLLSGIHNGETEEILERLPSCLQPYFSPAKSMIETSIGNVGMILHCAPLLLNTGWAECHTTVYKHYYDGITPSIAKLLEKLDNERMQVSRLLGYEVESTAEWLKRTYMVQGDTLYDCIQNNEAYKNIDAPKSLQHRYILEDVPCGLVPLEAIGKYLGVDMYITGIIINLANELLGIDFRAEGRNLKGLNIEKLLKP